MERLGEEAAAIKSSIFLDDIRQMKLLRMRGRPIMMALASMNCREKRPPLRFNQTIVDTATENNRKTSMQLPQKFKLVTEDIESASFDAS